MEASAASPTRCVGEPLTGRAFSCTLCSEHEAPLGFRRLLSLILPRGLVTGGQALEEYWSLPGKDVHTPGPGKAAPSLLRASHVADARQIPEVPERLAGLVLSSVVFYSA